MENSQDQITRIYGAQIMLRQLQAMWGEVNGVLEANDIECIHRMRVASRRLRAAQAVFDQLVFRRNYRKWERAIRGVTRALGAARDLDIQLETIRRFRLTVLDPRCKAGANRLFLRLLQQRAEAQKGVIAAVNRFNRSNVVSQAQVQLEKLIPVPDLTEVDDPYLRYMAAQGITEKLQILLSFEPFVDKPEAKAELHAMRIAAKHLRYTVEIFAPLFPQYQKNWLKVLKDIQDALGYMHDCDVWAEFIPAFIEDEKQLTRDYFGNLRGFRSLLPGIEVFRQNRESERQRRYLEFFGIWQQSVRKQTWRKMDAQMQKVLSLLQAELSPDQPELQEEITEETLSPAEVNDVSEIDPESNHPELMNQETEEDLQDENRSDQ